MTSSTRLADYRTIVGAEALEELRLLAAPLKGKSLLNINSTAVGGGVAEILSRMVPLFRELGLDARWSVLEGSAPFYGITKKMHNALHGQPARFDGEELRRFEETVERNAGRLVLGADLVFVHDPQPLPLVRHRTGRSNHWLWRCHIDLTERDSALWSYLRPMVDAFDGAVFSTPAFAKGVSVRTHVVPPSIDPLSEKNSPLSEEEIRMILDRLGVPRDKPLVTQVSRFDRLKDPVGVIQAFRWARKEVDARLLLVGGAADDDPEGLDVLAETREAAGGDPDILILNLPPTSHREINALQRASSVVMQKSLREGFGLTVAEALWKGVPVVGGAVGGIPLQIIHEQTGLLVRTVAEAATALVRLLKQPGWARTLGENGRIHVRQNFLLTRHIKDYLLLFDALMAGRSG